ncbi:MAG: glycosyltransferase family 4 protein [Verrucomicrobiaceae bacterium]|nr:glycosyltransferase family 4 protein [Verrucomicrobiaceae bacterium]
MKIANVIRRFVFEEWGGTESAVWSLSKNFLQEGENAEILATTALCKCVCEEKSKLQIKRFDYFYPHLFLDKKRIFALDKKGGNPFSFQLYKYIINGGFDIVHSHTLGRVGKTAVVAARKLGVPSVLTFHGGYLDVPQSEVDMMKEPLKYRIGYGKLLEKFCSMPNDAVIEADGIICVGENEYEKMRSIYPDKKIAHIPNGVDVGRFSKIPVSDFRKEFSIPKDRKLILCVSRIDPQKNQLALLELLDALLKRGEDTHLALVGFITDNSYLQKINELAKTLNLSGRLTICNGLLPESDLLLSAYKSADVFALASIHEPFGIVALEAWASGIPVIASNVGGLGRLIENGKTGFLFQVNNTSSAVEAFYAAQSSKDEICQNAYKLCSEKYSWQAVAKQTLDFYRSLKK